MVTDRLNLSKSGLDNHIFKSICVEINKLSLAILFFFIFYAVEGRLSKVDLLYYLFFWLIIYLLIVVILNILEHFVNYKISKYHLYFPNLLFVLLSLIITSVIGFSKITDSLLYLNEIVITYLFYIFLSFINVRPSKISRMMESSFFISFLRKIYNPYIIFLTIFISLRLWFFVKAPVVGIPPDSGGYFEQSILISKFFEQLFDLDFENLVWPSFKTRSIGYPLFLSFAYFLNDSHLFIALAQSLITLFSGLFFIRVFSNYSKSGGLILSLLLALGLSKTQNILYETSILTESLFLSFVLLFFTCLFGIIFGNWQKYKLLISIITAVLVLIKPGAFNFLLIIIILAVLIVRRTKNNWNFVYILIPFSTIMIAMGAYNYWQYGNFSNTNSGSQEISLVTNLMWRPDSSYPQEINQAIDRSRILIMKRINENEMQTLTESWNFEEMYPLYLAGHFYGPATEIANVTDGYLNPEFNYWVSKISIDTMKDSPQYFLKHYLVMMKYNFQLPQVYNSNVAVADVLNRVRVYSFNKHFSAQRTDIDLGTKEFMIKLGKEYSNTSYLPGAIKVDPISEDISLNRNMKFVDFYDKYSLTYEGILNSKYLLYLSFIILSITIFEILTFRMIGNYSIFILFCFLILFSSFSIIAFAEYSIPRYTYIYDFFYFTVPLIFFISKFKAYVND